MISVDFVIYLLCRQLLVQTKIPVQLATMCSRHGNHSRFQVSTPNYQESNVTRAWKDPGIRLTKKWIYKLSLHLFENMVYLQFKKPWLWSYSHATSLFKSVGKHTFMLSCIFPWFLFWKFRCQNQTRQ